MRTDGVVKVGETGGSDRDYPDVAVYPVGCAGDSDRNHVVTVWEAWDGVTQTRQTWLRVLDGTDDALVTGAKAPLLLTDGADGSHRWPRVTVTTDRAGEPAVFVVYGRTDDGQLGDLYVQPLLPHPKPDCGGLPTDDCYCSARTCLAPYRADGTPIAAVRIAPVAVDDARDGVWDGTDRPTCATGTTCGFCGGGLPAPVGKYTAECGYAPVTGGFDVVAVPPDADADPGVHLFAVAWSQGAGRDHGQWSFFGLYKFAATTGALAPIAWSGDGVAVPAVRLEGTPGYRHDDSRYVTEETSPALTYVHGAVTSQGRHDALAFAWHELRPGAPGGSRLRVAVHDLADRGDDDWPVSDGSDIVTLGNPDGLPSDEVFDCTSAGWSPHPAIASAGFLDGSDAPAIIALAWDADAYACGYVLPDAHAEDVYQAFLGYTGAGPDAHTIVAWDVRLDTLSGGFATFTETAERSIWSNDVNRLVLMDQRHPFAAGRPDGIVFGWHHLG